VGGGVLGLSTAVELRRRGRDVTVLEPGPIPHPRAASTDISKVVRMDYGSDDFMTAFAEAALAGWEAWNAAGPPLFHRDGFLLLTRAPMIPGGYEYESLRRMRDRGVAVARLDPLTLATRFPAWNADEYPDGYFNPTGGWAESADVVRALARRARRAGVGFHEGRAVALLERGGRVRGVSLENGRTLERPVTVVAAGAWTPALVPGLEGRMEPVGQPVLHLGVEDPARWSSPAFPVWAADIARSGWYGFPSTPDGRVKVGNHGPGMRLDPESDAGVPDEHVDRCRAFLRRSLPELADAPLVGSRVCFYCDTFDGRFWIDAHPDFEALVVAAGGSGHAFKFAPLLGPVVADAVEGRATRWGRPFRWRSPGPSGPSTEDARAG
jgi:glycine/D-amino acid oxidase-like deaminating enzyme